MNIAIIGYGKMGREIEKLALSRGHSIGLIIDIDNSADLNPEKLKDIDVAIEFSSPDSAFENICKCLNAKTPVVSGTTGWLDRWDQVQDLINTTGSGLFYASNFSIGVNIMFAINSRLAEIMSGFPEYASSIEEVHHIHKLDAPSGTAITLATQIIEKHNVKKSWSLEKADDEKLYIDAKREGEVSGYHKVIWDSAIDTIELSHNAKSRMGFVMGAVMAAEYLKGKSGIHSMKDMLNF